LYYPITTPFMQKIGVKQGKLFSVVLLLTLLTTNKVDFVVQFLREYKAICKKALICVSGAQIELFDEKKTRG
jgi:hypothetical protein